MQVILSAGPKRIKKFILFLSVRVKVRVSTAFCKEKKVKHFLFYFRLLYYQRNGKNEKDPQFS